MAVVSRSFAAALPHGDIREVLPNVYFVTGTVGMPGPLPVRFSRNMTVVREEGRLVLVNSIRLDDKGLAALDALGQVTDVIRLAANHGMDDPFYSDRYKAKVWAVAGQRYTSGFDTNARDVYFEADIEIDDKTELPLAGARVHVIHSKPPEGLLLLERHGGTLISGDCLQHWAEPDAYFSFLGKVMMRMMGFIRPYNVGPGWLKQCTPPKDQLRALLDLDFSNVLTAHGGPVVGAAHEHFRPAVTHATE
jgi:hypothetical protein